MAVTETLSAYSITAASNTPAGTDNVGPDLDNHLRDIKKNIRIAFEHSNSEQVRGRLWFDQSASPIVALTYSDGVGDIPLLRIDESANNIDAIVDGNNNELLQFAKIASAINQLKITNAATGVAPILEALGDDAVVDLALQTKGTGSEVKLQSTDAGVGSGPLMNLDRASPSPAVSDLLGQYKFSGRNSAGAKTTYGGLFCQIVDPTNGNEDGRIGLQAIVAGVVETAMFVGQGVWTSGATGGDQGTDTINASAYYDDGEQIVAATQAQQEAGTATATQAFTTPGNQQFHPTAAKCWGYASVAAGVPTLEVSENVTSITDAAQGVLTITIDGDFSTANYSVVATVGETSGGGQSVAFEGPTVRTGGSFELNCDNASGSLVDPDSWSWVAFGDR